MRLKSIYPTVCLDTKSATTERSGTHSDQDSTCVLFKALGIDLVKEKAVIKRKRKQNSIEEIPKDLEFIRHLDDQMPNGLRIEKFIHKFENMWILCEPSELRSINNKKWYADGTFYPITGLDECTQIYIISTKRELENNKKITTPVAFVLMPKRTKRMYEDMFQNLQKIAEQEIIPFALSCDFEAAVIKTVQKLFPSTKIQLCRFHFYQSIKRRLEREFSKTFHENKELQEVWNIIKGCSYFGWTQYQFSEQYTIVKNRDSKISLFDFHSNFSKNVRFAKESIWVSKRNKFSLKMLVVGREPVINSASFMLNLIFNVIRKNICIKMLIIHDK